ncbi:MAG: hypothetical protein WDZ76_04465 [Pseudohongiellaceae bacterium]
MQQDTLTLAVAYYMNGINFRSSAEKLKQDIELDDLGRPTKLTAIPLYYLASQAAELFLKAALLKRGFAESDLKKFDFRHNLSALLSVIQEKGLPVSGETEMVVSGLSEQHKHHQLRYTVLFNDGNKTYWPPLEMLFLALDELLLLTRISTHGR